VIRHLFQCFGNPQAVERAIEEATPNLEKIKEFVQRRNRIETELEKNKEARTKILRLLKRELIPEDEAERELEDLKDREARQRIELQGLQDSLENVPTPAAIQAVAQQISGSFRLTAKIKHANRALEEMTWDDRRALAQMVFSGTRAEGGRLGVYIESSDEQAKRRDKRWQYRIFGHLIHERGQLPMSKARMEACFAFYATKRDTDRLVQSASR
jgi:hypothetical protein